MQKDHLEILLDPLPISFSGGWSAFVDTHLSACNLTGLIEYRASGCSRGPVGTGFADACHVRDGEIKSRG